MSTALAGKPNMSNKTAIQFPQSMNFLDELEALSRETARRAFSLFQQRGQADGWVIFGDTIPIPRKGKATAK
jgi:hypothetical protein